MNRHFITKSETEACHKDYQYLLDQTHGHQATTWKPMEKVKDGSFGCCSQFCACKTEEILLNTRRNIGSEAEGDTNSQVSSSPSMIFQKNLQSVKTC